MRSATLLASLLVVAAGCGGGGSDTTGPPSPAPPTNTNSVTVGNNFFSPADIGVATGTAVTWQWASDATQHNVTFDDGAHSETQSLGSYSRTFTAAGTYPYHCTIHGAAVMHGTVTVSTGGQSSGGGGGVGGGYDYFMR
jgi:plastocyanin